MNPDGVSTWLIVFAFSMVAAYLAFLITALHKRGDFKKEDDKR